MTAQQFASDWLMPIAGYRHRTTDVYSVSSIGYYWSSSPEERNAVHSAKNFYFTTSNFTPQYVSYRNY